MNPLRKGKKKPRERRRKSGHFLSFRGGERRNGSGVRSESLYPRRGSQGETSFKCPHGGKKKQHLLLQKKKVKK